MIARARGVELQTRHVAASRVKRRTSVKDGLPQMLQRNQSVPGSCVIARAITHKREKSPDELMLVTPKPASRGRAVRAAFDDAGINPMLLADLKLVKDSEVRVRVKQLLYSRQFARRKTLVSLLNTRKDAGENDEGMTRLRPAVAGLRRGRRSPNEQRKLARSFVI
jgi:hypothetical protein